MKKVYSLYFSPTGGCRRIANLLAAQLADSLSLPLEEIDITLPEGRVECYRFSEDSLVVFACPTYAGRVPNKLLPELEEKILGSGRTPIVIASVYGGRCNEDAMRELALLADRNGFIPIAAVSCLSRHSMSDIMAAGRPDSRDLDELRTFARKTAEKMRRASPAPLEFDRETPLAPYYRPRKEDGSPANFLKAKPLTNPEKCDRCGICAGVCPLGSISREDPSLVTGVCIKCHACVRSCPTHAKYFDNEELLSHVRSLEKLCTPRLENQYLL